MFGFVLTCEKICFLLLLGLEDRDSTFRRGVFDPTPFPPGVGGGRSAEANSQSFEVITADRAIDESNVGNRMLRNMGWQEGLVSFLTLKLSSDFISILLSQDNVVTKL